MTSTGRNERSASEEIRWVVCEHCGALVPWIERSWRTARLRWPCCCHSMISECREDWYGTGRVMRESG